MKKHTEKAIDYFNRHQRNECFITSDGRVFHQEGTANSFAVTLKDRAVEHYTRAEVEQLQEETKSIGQTSNSDTSAATIQDGTPSVESDTDEKAQRTAELLALELTSKHYNEMLSLVKFFGLETKDKKADSLIEALTEYKSKLEK